MCLDTLKHSDTFHQIISKLFSNDCRAYISNYATLLRHNEANLKEIIKQCSLIEPIFINFSTDFDIDNSILKIKKIIENNPPTLPCKTEFPYCIVHGYVHI